MESVRQDGTFDNTAGVPPNFSQLGAIAARMGVPQGEIDAIREKHAKIRQAIEAGPRLLARLQDFGGRSDWSGAAAYADANDVLGAAATASQKEPEGANALYFFLSTLFHETGRCSDELDSGRAHETRTDLDQAAPGSQAASAHLT
jgi:hypothetical protein